MNRVTRRAFLVGAISTSSVLIAVTGCGILQPPTSKGPSGTTKALTFMAGYKPQADVSFVGVYVAQEMGYFKEQGLAVTIKHDTGQGTNLTLLAGKKIQVTTLTATDLIKGVTQQGIPFVSLAVLTQSGDEAMVSLQSSGIVEPKQFEGKTVGYKIYPAFEYLALLKAANVDRSKVKEVSVGFDPRVLTEGKVDVLPVFKSNEPDLLRHMGFPLNVIDPANYGVKVMGQVWATHRDLLASDPNLFERFVRASSNGLYYAFSHAKEAIDIVMKYAPTEDRSHQEFMLATEKESAITAQTQKYGLGWQTLDQWTQLQNGLADFGLIKQKADPATFFTDSIQKKIYQNGTLVWP